MSYANFNYPLYCPIPTPAQRIAQRETTPFSSSYASPSGLDPFSPQTPPLESSSITTTSSGATYDRLALDTPSESSDIEEMHPVAEDLGLLLFGSAICFIMHWETRSRSKTEIFDHPEVTYQLHVIQAGSEERGKDFTIKDNQFPMDSAHTMDFSPFFDALKVFHMDPKHKWSATNSKKMANKPLWKTHSSFKQLLKRAQRPRSLHQHH